MVIRALPAVSVATCLLAAALPCAAVPPPDRFLRAEGGAIRAGHGQGGIIQLRGVNLGGWLVLEGWQTPMDSSGLPDDWSVRETLDRRFGRTTRDSLLAAYQNTWIAETDLASIASWGFNVVRLPLWYRDLHEEDGTWRSDAFRRIDWLVRAAWAHSIYTILDLHGAPGGQSGADTTGRVRKAAQLWSDPTCMERTVEIWTRLARRYRGNPAVAGYDLLNEPIGAPDRQTLWDTYDRLYRAVRAADPDHTIFIEGCWGGQVDGKYMGWGWDVLPPPTRYGWTNVVYEVHMYGWSNTGDARAQMREVDNQVGQWRAHREWNVPCFVGEFNCFGNEGAWQYAAEQFAANGIGWCMWTYKATHGTGDDSWGIYNPRAPLPAKPDIQKDSAEQIRTKWAAWSAERAFSPNPMLQRSIGRR